MILAILQARVSSTRLPGKVLKNILDVPMLEHQIHRVLQSQRINELIIATSLEESDKPIADLCARIGLDCFRGSLDDVLDRFYQTAQKYHPDHIVRLTGDCPLMDAEVIDDVIDFYLKGSFDYASNTIEPTFPDGLDVEVFSFKCLQQAFHEASLPSQKEHVTPFLKTQPDRFSIGNYKQSKDYSHLRWTVDEPEDFEYVSIVYQELYPKNPNFKTKEILELLESDKELDAINQHIQRDEGLKKSLVEDERVSRSKV